MIWLALMGAVEALVWLPRYRSAHSPSHWWSSATTAMTCTARIVFVMLGASLAIEGDAFEVVAGGAAYVVSATAANGLLHAHLEKRKAATEAT